MLFKLLELQKIHQLLYTHTIVLGTFFTALFTVFYECLEIEFTAFAKKMHKNTINYRSKNFYVEMIWCAFNNGNDSILFGCIYRSPHSCREVNLDILQAINRASELCDEKKYSALLIAKSFKFMADNIS